MSAAPVSATRSRVVIITGAASGIGRALARAFVAAGDHVVVADVDAPGAQRVVDELVARRPGAAVAAEVDVRDADAVAEVVRRTHEAHGRIDIIVNNAGIGVGGEVQELTLAHWDRVIDVNLRGVVHGVAAAYPLMVEQGFGHVVNVASLAGLVPSPMLVAYAATKHAVVGLSLSLRLEAKAHGVKVTVVCPGFTDTAILDSTGPADLPTTSMAGHTRRLVQGGGLHDPEVLAAEVLRGIERDAPLVVAPRSARLAWRMMRVSPRLVLKVAGDQADKARVRLARLRAEGAGVATGSVAQRHQRTEPLDAG